MKEAKQRGGRHDRVRSLKCIRRTNLNDLPNYLLGEILNKVTCPLSLLRSKFTCKLWYSLIPSRFDPPFALIVNIPAPGKPVDEPHYASEWSDFKRSHGFKLKYLPCFDPEGARPVCVQASYKDLLLCTESFNSQRKFYIVNPWTMHWIVLPETLFWRGHCTTPIGLAAKKSSDDPLEYRFKVVRVTAVDLDFFEAEIYDSDTNDWTQVDVSHPYESSWKPTTYQGLAYKGSLHWMVKNGPIVAYDPFAPPDADGRLWCRFVERSDTMRHDGDSATEIQECITVSDGYIRMVQLITYPSLYMPGNEAHNLAIWKLEDYEKGEWVLEHRVYLKDMVSEVSWLQRYVRDYVRVHVRYQEAKVKKFPPRIREGLGDYRLQLPEGKRIMHTLKPLSCHPANPKIVYIHFPNSIISCNLLTKKLKVVSRINKQTKFYNFDTVVPISFQLEPTPLPIYPRTASSRCLRP